MFGMVNKIFTRITILFCFLILLYIVMRSSDRLQTYRLLTDLQAVDRLTWKLIGGGGFFGSSRTTFDSTFGGGRKLFLPT